MAPSFYGRVINEHHPKDNLIAGSLVDPIVRQG